MYVLIPVNPRYLSLDQIMGAEHLSPAEKIEALQAKAAALQADLDRLHEFMHTLSPMPPQE
jgi:hypothetical protein